MSQWQSLTPSRPAPAPPGARPAPSTPPASTRPRLQTSATNTATSTPYSSKTYINSLPARHQVASAAKEDSVVAKELGTVREDTLRLFPIWNKRWLVLTERDLGIYKNEVSMKMTERASVVASTSANSFIELGFSVCRLRALTGDGCSASGQQALLHPVGHGTRQGSFLYSPFGRRRLQVG
jgi:hypothetical protein